MARLVEDSDDELPELDVVVKKHVRRLPPKAAVLGCPKKVYPRVSLGSASTTSSKQEFESCGNQKVTGGPPNKLKARKQLLNEEFNNPLLHHLGKGKRIASSAALLKTPRSKPKRPSEKNVQVKTSISHDFQECSTYEDDDVLSWSDSSGFSDFVVTDSSHVDDQDSEDQIEPVKQGPRSTRRLVRGRRPSRQEVLHLDIHSQVENVLGSSDIKPIPTETAGDHQIDINCLGNCRVENRQEIQSQNRYQNSQSDLDETLYILTYSPPRQISPHKIGPIRSVTPPASPQKSKGGLVSPQKLPRIPATPHCPSMDSFWSQDAVNDWNDEYSPKKPLRTVSRKSSENETGSDLLFSQSQKKSGRKQNQHAPQNKKYFEAKKHEIAEAFLKEVDSQITGGKVSEMAASTGGIKIIWSKKLNTTAGRANWKRETMKLKGLGLEQTVIHQHHASIELAEKVIDDEERLLNVLAHEFCHLANFMVSGIKTNPHGKDFKLWAAKCSTRFGDRGVEVTTKHSYVIDYKYIWDCTNCGMKFKRHSKSIDPVRHQCGACKGKLVQTRPIPRANGNMSAYQTFMKENMKRIKEENPGSPQKEIMGLVAKEYKTAKLFTDDVNGGRKPATNIKGFDVSREESREESSADVDAVVMRLDFLDLSSP